MKTETIPFDEILKLIHSSSRAKQVQILKDIYQIGRLDAYTKPTTSSECLKNIRELNVLGYGNKWIKKDALSYYKKIKPGITAWLKFNHKGHKIARGLVLSTNITGAIKIMTIDDMSIPDAQQQADQLLFDISGQKCENLKGI